MREKSAGRGVRAVGWLLASLVSGVLLGLAGPPAHLVPLLGVALIVPLGCVLHRETSLRTAVAATTCVGLGQYLVLASLLRLPPVMAVALVTVLGACWALPGLLIQPLARRLPSLAVVFVVPCVFVLSECLVVEVLGTFGTAQSFARAAVPFLPLLSVAPFAGFSGIVFTIVLPQAAVALALRDRDRRALFPTVAAVALLATVGTAAIVWMTRPPTRMLTVAAVGWTYEEVGIPWGMDGRPDEQLQRVLGPFLHEAAAAGAEIVVAPEAAFRVEAGERDAFLQGASHLAATAEVTLVVGYFDARRDTNQAVVLGPDGTLEGEYRKSHLIAGMEDYLAGDGTLVTAREGSLGVMICQDDNFRDLGRRYGQLGVQMVAIPTNDWREVKDFHLQNTTLRAADSGFAVIRGATNGISAVIDSRGRVLAHRDHVEDGAGLVVADLALHEGGTPYAHAGDWLVVVSLLVVVGAVIAVVRRRSILEQ